MPARIGPPPRTYAPPPPTYENPANQYEAVAAAPAPLTISAQRDPNIDSYMNMFKQYGDEVAGNTDREAVNAMMRERDLTSGMAKEAFEDRALSTGGVTGLASRARTQVLQSGAANASRTNATMAATGRQNQFNAIQGGANMAVAGNNALRGQQDFALNTWQAAQQAAQAQAAAIAAQRANEWQQLMQLQQMGVTG